MPLLDPYDRRLLLDALRPPDDFSLDFAIGTTFSLDLLALLTAPLGFTRFELQENEGSNVADADAHLVLRTLREFADRITIFCQGGRIAVPPGHRPLLSMLEQMVVEVAPPTANRVFHPKVWTLRFVGPKGTVRYRLLVLSRNLTFAKCWDTILVLDGELQDRVNAIKANHPLGEFFVALPSMARRGLTDVAGARAALVADEIRKVRFECPPDVDEVAFHPLGIPGLKPQPFRERVKRLVVVSPFVSAGMLGELAERGRKDVLISRQDSLEKLAAKDLAMFSKVYVLNPTATPGEEDETIQRDALDVAVGLHAKCFIADDGRSAHVWTGSANATNAAFSGNVELLVQLTGKVSRLGTEAFLAAAEKDVGFVHMLMEFKPQTEGTVDSVEEQLDELLDRARSAIAAGRWDLRIEPMLPKQFRLTLDGAATVPVEELQGVTVYPITLSRNREIDAARPVLEWADVSTEGITAFFAFEVSRRIGNRTSSCRFVLNVPMTGAPDDRQEVLLRSMLRDRAQVIRFLLLLLGDTEDDPAAWRQLLGSAASASTHTSADGEALLEPLLRTLERDPSRLDHVDRLLRDLGRAEGEDSPIPPGLAELFTPIWEARGKVAK